MYEINTDFERPDPEWVERARAIYFCMIGGKVGPRYTMDPGINPLDPTWRVCGPALTVRPERASDVLMGQLAGKYVKPGDVVVIDAGGDPKDAALGGSMANGLKEAGATGIVVDGYILTAEVLRKRENIPVFSRGTVARAESGRGPGWLNVPVICGGVIVNPGDLIVGDEDGVAVVPRAWVPEVIEAMEQQGADRPLDGNIPPRPPQDKPYYERCGAEERVATMDNITINET
jgi:4-hydroxy-4-methyl-2-oxoglutarate aldolase